MLDRRLKERLVGAIVLVLLAVIFIPMFLQGEHDGEGGITETNIPARSEAEFNSTLVPIPEFTEPVEVPKREEPVSESVLALPPPEAVDAAKVVDTTPVEKPAAVVEPAVAPVEQPKKSTPGQPAENPARNLPQVDKGVTAWVIQVGSFANRENAEKLNKKLRDSDYRSFVQPVENEDGAKVYKVRVGPEILRSSARKLKASLAEKMSLPGIIMSYP